MTDTHQHEAIHTRLDYMEEKFESKMGDMADNIGKLAEGMDKIARSVSDISLLTERNNQHAVRLDDLDKRVDSIEKKLPVYDIVTAVAKRVGLIALTIIVGAILTGILVTA